MTPNTGVASTGGPSNGGPAAGLRQAKSPPARRATWPDELPGALHRDSGRFVAAVVGDVGWVTAAIQAIGVDAVRRSCGARAAAPASRSGGDARRHPGRPTPAARRSRSASPSYVLRQLCLQAAELGEDRLADDVRARLQALPGPASCRIWTTRRASRALSVELGRPDGGVEAVAGLPDGRVVSGGADGRVRVWDPAAPGDSPVELGRHAGIVEAVAVLAGWPSGQRRQRRAGADLGPGRAGRQPGRTRPPRPRSMGVAMRAWPRWPTAGWSAPEPTAGCGCGIRAAPQTGPVELGHHNGRVRAVTVLADGRVVSAGADGRVRVWDPRSAGHRPGRTRPSQRPGARGDGAGGRPGGLRRSRRPGAGVGPARRHRPGRTRPPQRPGARGGRAGRRPGGLRRSRRPGAGVDPQRRHRPG